MSLCHKKWLIVALKLTETDQTLEITVRLNGESKQQFNEIKKAKGIKNRTDVLRFIINEYHKSLSRRGGA